MIKNISFESGINLMPARAKIQSIPAAMLAETILHLMHAPVATFKILHRNMSGLLARMGSDTTRYSPEDAEIIIKMAALYKKIYGICPAYPKGGPAQYPDEIKRFKQLRDAWLTNKNITRPELLKSTLKLICRMTDDRAIKRNFKINSFNVFHLIGNSPMLELIRKHNLKIGFFGSIADGSFDAFSDVDMCWSGDKKMQYAVFAPYFNKLRYAYSVDLKPYTGIIPTIWPSEDELKIFAAQPLYLPGYYNNIHNISSV
jgi:hypothetical protein